MKQTRFLFLICVILLIIVSCKDEPEFGKEVFNGDWSGTSHVELFYLNGDFFRESNSGLRLELFYGGEGNIIRTSTHKDILWVAESNPDLFIYSEKVAGAPIPIDLYLTYIYTITLYNSNEIELYREDTYTENGTEYVRKTYWSLTK